MTKKELAKNIFKTRSFLCVGLDPDIEKFPAHIRNCPEPIFEFNKAIVDATADFAVAYKPNIAFYECYGTQGLKAFEDTVSYIKSNYPDKFIIADAKRGDIGNTARMYAKTFFEHLDVDAVTVAPYMGEDSVKPFLDYPGKWTIVLALTSNKGSHDFQLLEIKDSGKQLFEEVIEKCRSWGSDENIMFVAGATQGSMLEKVRRYAPDNFLLVPGVGAQGGSLEEVAKYGMNKDCGLLVNSSRGILYASNGTDFAESARKEAATLAGQMAQCLDMYL